MGTLSVTVMARTWLVKAGRDPSGAWEAVIATLCISAAAALRLLEPGDTGTLLAAAGLWSLAYSLLLALFLRVGSREKWRSETG